MIKISGLLFSVMALLAACSGMQTSSTVHQQIDEQEKRLPDFREEARLGLDRGQKLIREGQANVDEGRRLVREGQALIAEGDEAIYNASQMLSPTGHTDATVQRLLDDGTKKVRQGNAMVSSGNQTIADGQAMIRRGREQVERSLAQLRGAAN